jgi:uracil phosphoribosyltransferase
MVRNLGEGESIFNQFISEIRDKEIQKDRLRFRRNLERIGEIMAYEISKELEYENREVISPLGSAHMDLPVSFPILATILRAGLPLHQGLMNIFDHSGSAYVSAFRKHDKDGGFEIAMGYASSPGLTEETLIISDPMLATGSSMVLTYNEMMNFGIPKHTHIVCAIASTEGIDYVKKYLPMDKVSLWVGAIDEELTAQSYIVPGLGDAGDLAFGPKI